MPLSTFDLYVVLAAFVTGTVVGSFLNVVVVRLPRGESVVSPGSHCRVCSAPIRWYDNVPILSFVWLKGRCRGCGSHIGWRYPLVEALTGALFAGAVLRFGLTPALAPALILLVALAAITMIDLSWQIIPDSITLPGVVTGIAANVATGRLPVTECVLGIAIGGGIFLVIILVSGGGMGGGDMKLGAMLGAFLGWKITLLSLLVAVVLGGVMAIALLSMGTKGRKDPIPFGPFLAAGGAIGLFWGERILAWYLSGFAG
jgi:leader peptidase (prepilin peptidase)/N-methyltransferase